MSVLPISEGTNSSADLQVWNNAAYDNEYSEDISAITQSWGSLKSIFGNPKESLDSVLGKENQGPPMENQFSSVSLSNTPFKPVNRDVAALEKSRIKRVSKKGEENGVMMQKGFRDEKKIDEEIEEIESEIIRLSSRLEVLRIEKAKRSVKLEKRGRFVSAKFMEQTESTKITQEKNKDEDNSSFSGKPKVLRRGLSLGPVEIVNARRRGMTMGPTEIVGEAKAKQFSRQEMITPIQSRRKSCFLKLHNEEKAVKSLRKIDTTTNQVPLRQVVTTISSRKIMKKEDGVINSVQPKNLFKDGEKSVEKSVPTTNKKMLKPGRVVASRYNQNTSQVSAMRKRSLPENHKEDGKQCEKKRSLSNGKSDMDANNECKNLGTESRIKKRWEIPSKIVVHGSEEDEKSPKCVVVGPDLLLPRIRIGRFVNESPRDSGPAKRATELVGKKSLFGSGEEVEGSVCQTLSFDEEEN